MVRRLGFAVAVSALTLAASAWTGPSDAQAPDPDAFTFAAPVSSAEHEVIEGYFSLGDTATLMAKPGSDLHRFLMRQRGQKLRVTLAREDRPLLRRLDRQP